MHTILVLICSVIFTNAFSQQDAAMPVDAITKLITYTDKVELPIMDKGKIYDRALEWCNTYYKNPADVIREKDVASGIILCKARFKIYKMPAKKGDIQTDGGVVQYTLKIEMKTGRYSYTLTVINWKQVAYYAIERWMEKNAPSYSKDYADYLQQTNIEWKKIIAELVTAMNTEDTTKKDDW